MQLIKLKTDKMHKNMVEQTDMSKAMEVLLQGHAVTSGQLNDLLPRGASQNFAICMDVSMLVDSNTRLRKNR